MRPVWRPVRSRRQGSTCGTSGAASRLLYNWYVYCADQRGSRGARGCLPGTPIMACTGSCPICDRCARFPSVAVSGLHAALLPAAREADAPRRVQPPADLWRRRSRALTGDRGFLEQACLGRAAAPTATTTGSSFPMPRARTRPRYDRAPRATHARRPRLCGNVVCG